MVIGTDMILEMYLKGHNSPQNGNLFVIFLYLCSIGNNASILLCTGWSSSNRLHYMPSCTQHILMISYFTLYLSICITHKDDRTRWILLNYFEISKFLSPLKLFTGGTSNLLWVIILLMSTLYV